MVKVSCFMLNIKIFYTGRYLFPPFQAIYKRQTFPKLISCQVGSFQPCEVNSSKPNDFTARADLLYTYSKLDSMLPTSHSILLVSLSALWQPNAELLKSMNLIKNTTKLYKPSINIEHRPVLP